MDIYCLDPSLSSSTICENLEKILSLLVFHFLISKVGIIREPMSLGCCEEDIQETDKCLAHRRWSINSSCNWCSLASLQISGAVEVGTLEMN